MNVFSLSNDEICKQVIGNDLGIALAVAQRIMAFNQVRDIYPFRLGVLNEEDRLTKPEILQFVLANELGLQSRIRCCAFRWSDQELPKELMTFVPFNDSRHIYLEVNIPGRKEKTGRDPWVMVDPTIDSQTRFGLRFPKWDGINNTPLAVMLAEPCTLEESAEYMGRLKNYTSKQREAFNRLWGPFISRSNKWLQSLRTQDGLHA